jgi:hypothetical protein
MRNSYTARYRSYIQLAIFLCAIAIPSQSVADQKPASRFTEKAAHKVGSWNVRKVFIDGKYFACDANIYSNKYKDTPIRNISVIKTEIVSVQFATSFFKGIDPKTAHQMTVKISNESAEKKLIPNNADRTFVVLFHDKEFESAVRSGSITFDMGTTSLKIELANANEVFADLKKCTASADQ